MANADCYEGKPAGVCTCGQQLVLRQLVLSNGEIVWEACHAAGGSCSPAA